MTNMLVSAALFRNMDLALCLNVFGCLACFQGWHEAREERRRARHGVTYPKVRLFLCFALYKKPRHPFCPPTMMIRSIIFSSPRAGGLCFTCVGRQKEKEQRWGLVSSGSFTPHGMQIDCYHRICPPPPPPLPNASGHVMNELTS